MNAAPPDRAPRVVLVRPKKSENVGAAARGMKNFGFGTLVLVQPRCRLDAQAYALASHAGEVLENAAEAKTLDEALAGCTWAVGTSARTRRSEAVPQLDVHEALATLPDSGAIVFGPEDHGLSNEELDRCQTLLRIPTAAYASINLAQAVNIVAFAYFSGRPAYAPGSDASQAPEGAAPAPREDVERMYQQLVDLWHLIGYTDSLREKATLRLFRGIFDRARLRPRELAALRGLWAQAAWAAEREPEDLPGRS